MRFRLVTPLVLLLLAGCSSDEEPEVFPAEAAEALARQFHEALLKGDVAAAARLARFPFHYKELSRTWPDATAVEKNLAKERRRFQPLIERLDRIETFSRRDLLAGRWPRGRVVPESERLAAVEALGVGPYGWVARVHSETRVGYLLVLNPEGMQRLAVQMLDV